MTVYLDLVMVLNFLVDYLLLSGTNRLSGFPGTPGRCAAAALLGAVYSGACMLPEFRFLGDLLWRCVSFGLMTVMAFGCDRSAVKRGGLFLLLSMSLGGIALSMGKGDFAGLILGAAFCALLCRVAFGGHAGDREYVPMVLEYKGRTVSVIALRDTGNNLRDPVSGDQVLILAGHIAQRLTGLTEAQLRDPLATIAGRPIPGLRLIPYRSVGQAGGMLLAMRFDNVKIGSRMQSAIVAFAPEGLGRGEVYQALTGGAL
ncbi:MAG: sigma-E processing peptidase SpoIIGA [Oscillospiraceae bacterium]|nr:sigma-E processing peptidase SpoIIGA [Oscillospiraceae bacterium]